jgi:hypothetical protein
LAVVGSNCCEGSSGAEHGSWALVLSTFLCGREALQDSAPTTLALKNPLNPIGSLAAKETTMKAFLKNVFATLRKTNAAKSPRHPERPSATPALGVRSQVKAGIRLRRVVGD